MSAAVEKLEELLTRVQRNRAKPRRRRGSASMRAPGGSRRPYRPTPLEMAVEVELDRPKVQPSAARVRPTAEPSPPAAAPPAAAKPAAVAPPAAAPPAAAKPDAAKPAVPPAAVAPPAAAKPAAVEPAPAAVERRAEPLKAVAIEAPPLASAKPVVESTGEVPSPMPTTFGELMSRTLALLPK